MKKSIFAIIALLIYVNVSMLTYGRDIVRSKRISNSYGIASLPQNNPVRAYLAPTASAVNITVKNETGNPDLKDAINLAKKYLGDVIKEDFPITILIKYGAKQGVNGSEQDDFSDLFGTYDHLAITTSHYVLNNYSNRNPNTRSSFVRYSNESNTLMPEALANREYLGDTDPFNDDIVILLNPDKNFYLGEDPDQISANQYDLVTVLLREMITGCGFASSLSMSDMLPSSMREASDNVFYPVLFDRKLKNSDNIYFSSIERNEYNIENIYGFLYEKDLFYAGNRIFRDDIDTDGLTMNTTNRTFDPNEDPNNPDLMTCNYRIGKSSVIRKITPKTVSVLNNLGWDIDVVTGQNSAHYPIVNNNSTGFILNPGQSYSFSGSITGMYDYNLSSFDLVLVQKDGEHYTYKTGYPSFNLLPVTYNVSELPANEEWQRDPETGHIIGYLQFYGTGQSGGINYAIDGFQRVLLPLNPLKVNIAATKQNVTTSSMDAKVVYNSNGATQYTINYSIFGEATNNAISVNDKDQVAYILSNLNPAKRYSVYVQATNLAGSAASETVTIGSTYTSASCVLTKNGNNIKYQIKVGETIMDDLVINSAGIYNTSGILKMTLPNSANQYYSIASLPAGVYVLKVEVKDYGLCGKTFIK